MGNISASIVLYKNDFEEVMNAINSLLKGNNVKKIYLIDNSPTNELEKLKILNPIIEYISNPTNPGFGEAHNIAIRKAEEQKNFIYHLILNPDVEFGENVIEELKKYMDENIGCGIVTPKIFYKTGEVQYLCKRIPSPVELFGKRINIKYIKDRITNRLELRNFNYKEILNVPYLSGCFMFCRLKSLQDVNGFDKRYFMYMEDLDLTRTLHRKYTTIFYPKVSIIHGYRSESKTNKKLLIALISSAIKYFNKYGWLFDSERKRMNKELDQTIKNFQIK